MVCDNNRASEASWAGLETMKNYTADVHADCVEEMKDIGKEHWPYITLN